MDPAVISLLVLMVALLVYFIWRMVTGRSSRTSTKDWLLYLIIAPLMILAFLGIFSYAESKGIQKETTDKWMGIFITALIVFGLTVKAFWQYRRKRIFWAELSVLIFAHFVILQRLQWPAESFIVFISVPEFAVLFVLFRLMFPRSSEPPSEGLP